MGFDPHLQLLSEPLRNPRSAPLEASEPPEDEGAQHPADKQRHAVFLKEFVNREHPVHGHQSGECSALYAGDQ